MAKSTVTIGTKRIVSALAGAVALSAFGCDVDESAFTFDDGRYDDLASSERPTAVNLPLSVPMVEGMPPGTAQAAPSSSAPSASSVVPMPEVDGGPPASGSTASPFPAASTAPAGPMPSAEPVAEPLCDNDFDCDDGVGCTEDRCTPMGCSSTPSNDQCVDAPDGQCDPVLGCQYPNCSERTCIAGPCETAVCEQDACVRTSTCTDSESCCAGACVPKQCSDGVECTVDSCDSMLGCQHQPQDTNCASDSECKVGRCELATGCVFDDREGACDDGVFCNGPDTCAAGACTDHAGPPCPGESVCSEEADTCTGCVSNADCPETMTSGWSDCEGFDGTCDETGTESRTITEFACMAGTCEPTEREQTRECTRDGIAGMQCAPTEFSDPTGCDFGGSDCAQEGTLMRTRTRHACNDGRCTASTDEVESECSRATGTGTTPCDDGDFCNGADTCRGGTCSSHAGDPCPGESQCDSRQAMCTGCASDADCPDRREPDWDDCEYDGFCDLAGTRTGVAIEYSCSQGECVSREIQESETCTRSLSAICRSSAEPVCDESSRDCVECTARGDCNNDEFCVDNECVECRRDSDCSADEVDGFGSCGDASGFCATTGTQTRSITSYSCNQGECVSTRTLDPRTCSLADPCPNSVCDESADRCVECTNNTHCDGGCLNNTCVECTNDGHCGGDVCDLSRNRCVECVDTCNNGVCANNVCVECAEDGDCPGGVCDDNQCEECAENRDCPDGFCEQNRCVECRSVLDCNDENDCTADSCNNGACRNQDLVDHADCEGGVCFGGACLEAREFTLTHWAVNNEDSGGLATCVATQETCEVRGFGERDGGVCSFRCPRDSNIFVCCSADVSCLDPGREQPTAFSLQGPFSQGNCGDEEPSYADPLPPDIGGGRLGVFTCRPSDESRDAFAVCLDSDI